MAISMLRRRLRARSKRIVERSGTEISTAVDIDLTRPDWDSVADLSEDFDNKMESFMLFDDGPASAEREWLTG